VQELDGPHHQEDQDVNAVFLEELPPRLLANAFSDEAFEGESNRVDGDQHEDGEQSQQSVVVDSVQGRSPVFILYHVLQLDKGSRHQLLSGPPYQTQKESRSDENPNFVELKAIGG
jgi:hypothetical protein